MATRSASARARGAVAAMRRIFNRNANGADGAALVVTVGQDYSGNVSPEPPNLVGKSLNLGRPSLIEIVLSL